jgi:hypothetical protein
VWFGTPNPHIGELPLKLLKMPSRRRVNDDGLIPSGTLHFSNAVSESFEPTPGVRCSQVEEQFLAVGVGQGNDTINPLLQAASATP